MKPIRPTLMDRIQPYLDTNARADIVSARPLTEWFSSWMRHTGDNVTVTGRGFDLPPTFITDLVYRERRVVTVDETRVVCRALRVDPQELWPLEVAHRIGC